MQVLIVDEEPRAQIALTNILARRREVEGVDTANDAVEALDKLTHRSFDVLLLDIEYAGSFRHQTPRPTNRTWPSSTVGGFCHAVSAALASRV